MASLLEYPAVADPSLGGRMVRRADGLLHYTGLTPCLTELLDISAHRYGGREAVVEAGADRGSPTRSCGRRRPESPAVCSSRESASVTGSGSDAERRAMWCRPSWECCSPSVVPCRCPGTREPAAPARSRGQRCLLVLDGELPSGTPFIDDGASPPDTALLFLHRRDDRSPQGRRTEPRERSVHRRGGDRFVGRRGGRGPARGGVAAQFGGRVCPRSCCRPWWLAAPSFSLPSSDADSVLYAIESEGIERLRLPLRCARRWHASPRPFRAATGPGPRRRVAVRGHPAPVARAFSRRGRRLGLGDDRDRRCRLVVQMSSGADRPESPHGEWSSRSPARWTGSASCGAGGRA